MTSIRDTDLNIQSLRYRRSILKWIKHAGAAHTGSRLSCTDILAILSDNYSGCVALRQYFGEQAGESGKYIELLSIVADTNTWNRSKGFHSVADRFLGLKMVAQQSAAFDRTKALKVLEAIPLANRDIDAVFCGNDDGHALSPTCSTTASSC